MKKKYIPLLLALLCGSFVEAQYAWYENESQRKDIAFSSATKGTFFVNQVNPDADVSKFERNGVTSPLIQFNLSTPITDLSGYSMSLRAYIAMATADLTTTNSRIRLYLRNSSIGGSSAIYKQKTFSQGNTWQNFNVSFNGTSIPQNVLNAGGYDQIMIGLASGDNTGLRTTYYIDDLADSEATNLTFDLATKGTYTAKSVDPQSASLNKNSKVSKFVRDGQNSPFIFFNLPLSITDFSSHTVSLKARTSMTTGGLTTSNKRIRVYFRNSTIGGSSSVYKQRNFTQGQDWESFTFDFSGTSIPQSVLDAGGYDQMMVSFANGDTTGLTSTYHLDTLEGSSSMEFNGKWLDGSWGLWYQVPGGTRLDSNPVDYGARAQELATNFPSMGHVLSSASHPAHGYFFTLRNNPYVDIANEIHPDMVPSLANEQIILDVIAAFKNAGKKVMLYIATDGPAARSGTPDNAVYLAAWQSYYRNDPKFTGNDAQKEGQAYRLLCRGFFERFRDAGVDGYWLDHTNGIIGNIADFVAMMREVDPNVAIATNSTLDNNSVNLDPDYFTDANGNDLLVDTDGPNEQVGVDASGTDINRDYKIKRFGVTDPYMDFTGGHPTPLQQGAPPNSWAYEEYTFVEIADEPTDSYNGDKTTIKHAFIPMRDRWTPSSANFMWNSKEEQAYRFVRTLTDAGGSITFATTIDGNWHSAIDGSLMQEEEDILDVIETRLSMTSVPDYIPYARPVGAFLVGEPQPILQRIHENQGGFCGVDGTIASTFSGYTGSGYADSTNTSGAGVDWQIDGPAGWHTFTWRYSNAPSADRTADFIVDGTVLQNDVSFPTTGSWSSWTNTSSVTVYLGAGVKDIRLESTTSSGLALIDRIEVSAAGISRGSCN